MDGGPPPGRPFVIVCGDNEEPPEHPNGKGNQIELPDYRGGSITKQQS
jgi:hypothetical protein